MKEPFAYLGIRGGIAAFDKRRGHIVWHARLRGSAYVMFVVDEEMIFAYTGGHLYGVDRRSGEVLWENGLKGMGFGMGTLALAGNAQSTDAMAKQIMTELRRKKSSGRNGSMSDD